MSPDPRGSDSDAPGYLARDVPRASGDRGVRRATPVNVENDASVTDPFRRISELHGRLASRSMPNSSKGTSTCGFRWYDRLLPEPYPRSGQYSAIVLEIEGRDSLLELRSAGE